MYCTYGSLLAECTCMCLVGSIFLLRRHNLSLYDNEKIRAPVSSTRADSVRSLNLIERVISAAEHCETGALLALMEICELARKLAPRAGLDSRKVTMEGAQVPQPLRTRRIK